MEQIEEILKVIVNNGLGIISFFCLIYFMKEYIEKNNRVMDEISKTLLSIEKSMNDLSNRIDKVEKKIENKKAKKEEIE